MSQLTKQALIVENNQSFPNNNAGLITPTNLRTFNGDMIDSTVNQIVYTADSASFDSRINAITASVPDGTVSGSSQIILTDTTGNLGGNRITGSVTNAVSASYAVTASFALNVTPIDTGSFLTTASVSDATITFTKGDSSTFGLTVDNVVNSTYAQNTITTGKNLHSSTLLKGTPLFFTASGTAGNLVGVYPADAGNPARMPAGGIAGESIAVGAEGIVLLDGYIGGVDTSIFASGDEIFVGVGGGYTNVAPTGSALIQHLGNVEKSAVNGSGVIQMMGEVRGLPNIPQNNVWVGDSNGVPQPINKNNLGLALTGSNNTFTGTQTFDNIVVNGTGSFAYIQSVTGSAKIIGDAFIILNNDTPTERYAGIIVQDSGSAGVTASFQFDGLTNDWFYEYTGSDPLNFGVAMFGPEYGTKGSPVYPTNNTILKGNGGHHVLDSSITDDGTLVTINANVTANGFVGNGLVSGSSQITSSLDGRYAVLNGSNQFNGTQTITGSLAITGGSVTILPGGNLTVVSGVTSGPVGEFTNINNYTASNDSKVNSLISSTGSYATTGSNQFNGNQVVTGSLYQEFNAPGTETQTDLIRINGASVQGRNYNNVSYAVQNYPSFGPFYEDAFVIEYWDSLSYNYGSEFTVNGGRAQLFISPSGSTPGTRTATFSLEDLYNGTARTSVQGSIINIGTTTAATNSITIGRTALPQLNLRAVDIDIDSDTIDITTTNVSLTGSLEIENDLTVRGLNTILSSSLKVQDTSTFDGLATFTAGATVQLPLILSGSVRAKVDTLAISSQTASIDFSQASMFELTLVSGSTTHLDVSNVNKGQTLNVLVKQPAVGTGLISFAPEFLQPSGSEYTPTNASNAQDILTLVTFSDTNTVYVANVKQLV